MKTIFFYLIVASCSLTVLAPMYSCQKNPQTIQAIPKESAVTKVKDLSVNVPVSVNHGWLNFPNMQRFEASTSPAWPGFKKYGDNVFEKTLKWTASGLFNEIWLDHFNFHFRVNYRSHWAERMIRE